MGIRADMARDRAAPKAAPACEEAGGELAVRDMATADHFLLVAIRGWVSAAKHGRRPAAVLRKPFELARIPMALAHFDALMAAAAASASRPLEVRCLRCPRLGEGERAILSTVALVQAGRPDLAARRLAARFRPEAARDALPRVESLARWMEAANLPVPLRPEYLDDDLGGAAGSRAFPAHGTVQ